MAQQTEAHIITIPGQTISKKNSKRIVIVRNKPMLVSSQAYQNWAHAAVWQLKTNEFVGREWQYPLFVGFHFARYGKGPFDYNNLTQGILDVLIEAGIIKDDNMNCVIPCGFSWEVDKHNPRCVVAISEAK